MNHVIIPPEDTPFQGGGGWQGCPQALLGCSRRPDRSASKSTRSICTEISFVICCASSNKDLLNWQRYCCRHPQSRTCNHRKHVTLTQCWPNVGSASTKLDQHWVSIVSMYRVCWDIGQRLTSFEIQFTNRAALMSCFLFHCIQSYSLCNWQETITKQFNGPA